jgi:hypothetical protein
MHGANGAVHGHKSQRKEMRWTGSGFAQVSVTVGDGRANERAKLRALLKREERRKARMAKRWAAMGVAYDLEHNDRD